MGLINNDVYTATNGVQKSGTYISFGNDKVSMHKSVSKTGVVTYAIRSNAHIYWDNPTRIAGKVSLASQTISTTLTADQLSGNLYGYLYAQLKTMYKNTTDA
jgi:hypothetical protein